MEVLVLVGVFFSHSTSLIGKFISEKKMSNREWKLVSRKKQTIILTVDRKLHNVGPSLRKEEENLF